MHQRPRWQGKCAQVTELSSYHVAFVSSVQVLPKTLDGGQGQGQRVILGDTAGVLQGFAFKGGKFCQVFKNVAGPRQIRCVALGRGTTQRDKVFVAEGTVVSIPAGTSVAVCIVKSPAAGHNLAHLSHVKTAAHVTALVKLCTSMQVKAFDRRGAQFFRFTTPLTDDITNLEVIDTRLFVFTDFAAMVFEETTEKAFYTTQERINCSCVVPLKVNEAWVALIGCQDRCLRIVDGTALLQARNSSSHMRSPF